MKQHMKRQHHPERLAQEAFEWTQGPRSHRVVLLIDDEDHRVDITGFCDSGTWQPGCTNVTICPDYAWNRHRDAWEAMCDCPRDDETGEKTHSDDCRELCADEFKEWLGERIEDALAEFNEQYPDDEEN